MLTKLLPWVCAFLAGQYFLAICAEPDAVKIDVRTFGAAGDGKTSDTAAIQQAIDAGR